MSLAGFTGVQAANAASGSNCNLKSTPAKASAIPSRTELFTVYQHWTS